MVRLVCAPELRGAGDDGDAGSGDETGEGREPGVLCGELVVDFRDVEHCRVHKALLRAMARLGIKLIHSTPGRPQGRGKARPAAWLRQLDFHAEELRLIDTDLGQVALGRPEVLRLMSVPGVDATGVVDRGRGRGLHPFPDSSTRAGAPVRKIQHRLTATDASHSPGERPLR